MSRSVCVVVPIHNQAEYLFRAVSSVVWQLRSDDHLIIVDDGSTDRIDPTDTDSLLKRARWLSNPTRQGVSYSRNRAVRETSTEWIKFLDADDVLAPFALKIIHLSEPEYPLNVKVVMGGLHRIHNGRYFDYLHPTQDDIDHILEKLPTLPSATFVRREALLEVGLFDERLDVEEDWDLWLRIHQRYGPAAFAVVSQPVCYYWIDDEERAQKLRAGMVEGVPVREYLRRRYGANPQ